MDFCVYYYENIFNLLQKLFYFFWIQKSLNKLSKIHEYSFSTVTEQTNIFWFDLIL